MKLAFAVLSLLSIVVVMSGCVTVQAGLPYNFGPDARLIPCSTIAGSVCDVVLVSAGEPSDGEAWVFEARLIERIDGLLRVGRVPHDLLVVGSREACEAYRAGFQVRDQLGRIDTPPTEPCKHQMFYRKLVK